jgi:hypothetical protein
MKRLAALALAFFAFGTPLLALDPLPDVQKGRGYTTWTLESDHPMVKLEDVLHDLRSADRRTYLKMLDALGIKQELRGREMAYPELVQPVDAQARFLGFERRKMAVVTAPVRGKHRWYAVILRQEGQGEAYWRARQVYTFDTDPVEGYSQKFPDILGDDIRFYQVRHIVQDDIYGRARVDSIFRYDERGQLRMTFQEMADAYRPAKFQGEALRLDQQLVYKGDQTIVRKLTLKYYPWMKREEWDRYEGVTPTEAKPAKVLKVEERFAWDPAEFNFYGGEQEIEKLVTAKSPYIRRDAARRLGEHLKTAHPQLQEAVWKDKDPLVRMQSALALEAIADPAALPAVEKALLNYDEPDEVREAQERALKRLEAAKAGLPEPTVEPTPVPKKKKAKAAKPGQEAAMPAVAQPKITENK